MKSVVQCSELFDRLGFVIGGKVTVPFAYPDGLPPTEFLDCSQVHSGQDETRLVCMTEGMQRHPMPLCALAGLLERRLDCPTHTPLSAGKDEFPGDFCLGSANTSRTTVFRGTMRIGHSSHTGARWSRVRVGNPCRPTDCQPSARSISSTISGTTAPRRRSRSARWSSRQARWRRGRWRC